MWFLIRSAFWLSIVFALLPWPDNAGLRLSPPVAIWLRTRDAIGAALGKARAAGGKVCADSPLACLKAAARIGQFSADEDATREASAVEQPPAPPGGETGTPPGSQRKAPPAGQLKAPPASRKAALSSPPPH